MDYSLLHDFEKELECQYKGETYSVRDNGAVLRHPKNDNKPRPTDNIWTFGKYDTKTGYAKIAGESVHRIVATAFHGLPPSSQHVVDHIDTNRRNNRPENLRWITKLETLFQLWNERTSNEIIAHNIYSEWNVLITEDPKLCLEKKGCVYGKVGRNIRKLRDLPDRQINNVDYSCWEIIKL